MRFLKIRLLVTLAVIGMLATSAGHRALQAQVVVQTSFPPTLVIHLKSNALGFGTIPVNVVSAPQTITLQNIGSSALSILSAQVEGPNAGEFLMTNGCPGSLAASATCTMTFTFAPRGQGGREARLVVTTDTHVRDGLAVPQFLWLTGFGQDPNIPQPEVGPLDPRTGYPIYYSDGFNTLELCLDDPLCAVPKPIGSVPGAITLAPETTNWPGEGFYWTADADVSAQTGWAKAILVMGMEAANEANLAGQQWMFGRLRIRAEDVPAGIYRFTHPFGTDIVDATGDPRIFETSDIGCTSTPCDFTIALNSRLTRFLQCVAVPAGGSSTTMPPLPQGAPAFITDPNTGGEYLGDPAAACSVVGSSLRDSQGRYQNYFKIDVLTSGTPQNGTWQELAYTESFINVSGKRRARVTAPPPAGNQAPVAVDDVATTVSPTAVSIPVLANDTDANDGNAALAIQGVTQGVGGTAIPQGDGTILYTPDAGYIGIGTFTYVVRDPAGLTDIGAVTVTINPPAGVNRPPVAANDSYSYTLPRLGTVSAALPGTIATLPGVLANDTDADLNPLTATIVAPYVDPLAPPVAGVNPWQFILGPEGSVQYAGGLGIASATQNITFTYVANDGSSASNVATVTVTLNQPVGQPIAVDDFVTTPQDTVLRIDADTNDNPNGTPGTAIRQALASFVVRRQPANGTVRALRFNPGVTPANFGFEYTPNPGFVGTDTFTYTVDDGATNFVSNVATVTINVSAAGNNNPVAVNDVASTLLNLPVIVDVLGNDTDADGDLLDVTGVSALNGGTAVINADNSITFTPSLGFTGVGGFDYAISDGRGGLASGSVAVTVSLTANTAPVAVADTVTVPSGVATTISVLNNDFDPQDDPISVATLTQPAAGGTVARNITATGVVFTPAAGFTGQATFTYTISDGLLESAPATVTVTVTAPANRAPVAVADSYTANGITPLVVNAPGVMANDTDADGNPLTATLLGGPTPTGGTLVFNANGSFSYTHNVNPAAPVQVSFSYRVNDGLANSNTAFVTITVNRTNANPVAVADSATTAFQTLVSIPVLANDTDADGDVLSIGSVTAGVGGTPVINGTSVNFTPAANFSGAASFTYVVNDGRGGSATGTVSVTVQPRPNVNPVAVADSATTAFQTLVSIPVLANDTDADGDVLSIASVTAGVGGTPAINGTSVNFTPATGFSGAASFTYVVSDGRGGSATGSVSVTVQPRPNVNPVAVADSATTPFQTLVSIPVLANDTDADGDVLSIASVAAGTGGTPVINGTSVNFTPAAAFSGTATFTYVVSDGRGGSATGNVSITVNPAPLPDPAPVGAAVASTTTTVGNKSVTITTTQPNLLLVAFVGADGPNGANLQAATISGGGLTWTRARQQRAQSGVVEIWTARAATAGTFTITSTLQSGAFTQRLLVQAFANVASVGAVGGASSGATALTAAATPITVLAANSLVYAVGNDWANVASRTFPANQTLVGPAFNAAGLVSVWVQRLNGLTTAAGAVNMNTAGPTSNEWNMAAIELRR